MSASGRGKSIKPMAGIKGQLGTRVAALRTSDTGKAAGLAGAMIANNVIALVATVLFAHLLSDYGSLGALISYLLILQVFGQAMQVATAREGVLGHLGLGHDLSATMKRWTRSMVLVTVGLTVISILLREPIASAVGVNHVYYNGHFHNYAWAAALGIPTGCLYLEVSLLRGSLQGVSDYKGVGLSLIGEQGVRLITGAVLAAAVGVTGAYLGSIMSYVAMSLYCVMRLRQYATSYHAEAAPTTASPQVSLWRHVRGAAVPIAGLAVFAVLQNIDLIAAKHRFTPHVATSYAAVAVAAKVLIWVAIGAGFYLVPEVSRRRSEGEDTRPVLLKTLAIIVVAAVPCLLIFTFASHLLISTVFGAGKAGASNSLLPLGAAFTVLACTYLAIQYMLALKRTWFLLAIGAIAVAEPVLLLQAPREPAGFAVVVLAIQAAAALVAFTLALWPTRELRPTTPPPRSSAGGADEVELPQMILR